MAEWQIHIFFSVFSEILKIQNIFLSRKWYFCMFWLPTYLWKKKMWKMVKYSFYLHKQINLLSFFYLPFCKPKVTKTIFYWLYWQYQFLSVCGCYAAFFIILQPRTFLSVSVNKWKKNNTEKSSANSSSWTTTCLR